MRVAFVVLGAIIITTALAFALPGRTVEIQTRTLSGGLKLAFVSLPFVPSEKLLGEGEERVNILLVGRAGPGWIAGDLADSIIVASLKPKHGATFISIPRDLLVLVPESQVYMRVNALAPLGEQEAKRRGEEDAATRMMLLQKAAEEITALQIPYVAIVNVGAVEKVVTAFGGVQVNVPKRIYDPVFPTPGGGIETFALDAGWRVLDGRTAGKYVRTRHDAEGDFGRMRRQQQVIEAALVKARGLNFIGDFGKILELMTITEEHTAHNFSMRELKRIWELARDFEPRDLRFLALDRTDLNLLESETVNLSGVPAPVLVPRAGMFDYTEIRERIKQELNLE